MNEKEVELLPCPFCGESGPEISEGSTHRWLQIMCCGEVRKADIALPAGHPVNMKLAAEVWNTRTPTVESLTARVAELDCPTNEDVWLEFGWIKDANRSRDMLWYNEGNTAEFEFWYRSLMKKLRTNEPRGEMYFKFGVYQALGVPRKDMEITCKDSLIEAVEATEGKDGE